MNLFVLLVLLFAAVEVVLSVLQFLLRKRKVKPAIRAVLIAVKLLLGIGFAVLVLAGPVQLRVVQPLMMAAYVALFADGVADLCCCILFKICKKERSFAVVKSVSLAFGIAFLVFGILNMQTVSSRSYTFTSEKLKNAHKIVFAADVHVGSAQPFSVTQKTVEAIRAEQPDAVILGGDICDDYTTKAEMEDTFALFKDFGCPVYYVYGNHDLQGHADYAIGLQYTEAEFEKAITDNDILILRDSFAQLGSDVLILGREDMSAGEKRIDAAKIVNPLPDAYLIVADHQPGGVKENLAVGMDLQISGHTHAGQLFPLRWFYALIGYVYGQYQVEDAKLVVSAGTCGWRMPLRTEAHCQYDVINLKPEAPQN